MLVQSPTPKGIDFKLQRFQTDLHTYLITRWGLDTLAPDYTCYDRCYRNQTKNGFIPEVYTQNGSYKEVGPDDKVKVLSFFGLGSSLTYSPNQSSNTAQVHLIFCADLKKLKGGTSRPDEETRQDVQHFAALKKYGFILTSIQIGIDNVFSEYSGLSVKFKDMQPLHCFRFNFEVLYNFKDHECN